MCLVRYRPPYDSSIRVSIGWPFGLSRHLSAWLPHRRASSRGTLGIRRSMYKAAQPLQQPLFVGALVALYSNTYSSRKEYDGCKRYHTKPSC